MMGLARLSSRARPRRATYGGVSAVAGAVFFVIIMITLAVGVMFWSLSTHREMNELDLKRLSEQLQVNSVSFPADGVVRINVTNLSPEAIHVVAVWFVDNSTTPATHYRVNGSRIDGAWVPDNVPWHVITVHFSWAPGHLYGIELVTDRGRVFHLGYYLAG